MATTTRVRTGPVTDSRPVIRWTDFVQLVRLLELQARGNSPVGGDGPPGDEVVRFRNTALPDAPPPDWVEAQEVRPGQREVQVNFFGLYRVLPDCYASLVQELERETPGKPCALRDLLDLVNHRLLSLLYRVYAQTHPVIEYERCRNQGPNGPRGPFVQQLLALVGLGDSRQSERFGAVPPELVARYSGLLLARPRPAAALEAMLADYSRAAVRVIPWRGQELVDAPPGAGPTGASAVRLLGGAIRLVVGPLSGERLRALFPPDGLALRPFVQLATLFLEEEGVEFDLELRLPWSEMPAFRPGEAQGSRLSWTCRLRTPGVEPRGEASVVLSADYCRRLAGPAKE